ncbi:MAG: hypothetical protein AB1646_03230 [Thermodesulfobacteriota bacterium]
MTNQRGSAIVIVMMLMTILALVGAGLLLQSRQDTKLAKSRITYDRDISLADGAARIGYYSVKHKTVDNLKYSGLQQRDFIGESDKDFWGYWDAYRTLCGIDTTARPGDQLGSKGYYQQFWVSEGTGARARRWDDTGSTSYKQDDVVSHLGSTYKRLYPGSSGEPGKDFSVWEAVAPNASIVQMPVIKAAME